MLCQIYNLHTLFLISRLWVFRVIQALNYLFHIAIAHVVITIICDIQNINTLKTKFINALNLIINTLYICAFSFSIASGKVVVVEV